MALSAARSALPRRTRIAPHCSMSSASQPASASESRAMKQTWREVDEARTRSDHAARVYAAARAETFEEDDAERRLYHREDARRAAAAARARSVFSASEAPGRGCVVA